jgi:hypothetical protein
VLSTGLQLKGNNTNTASPAGFIGEVKIASNTSGTALSNNTIAQLSSITLTAGNWEITGTVLFSNSGLNVGNVFWRGILSATTASSTPIDNQGGNIGMGFCENTAAIASNATPATHPIICLFMGPCNVSISTNTTYYLNGGGQNSGSFNVTGLGVIRAIRIG